MTALPRRYTVEPYPLRRWVVVDTQGNTTATRQICTYDSKRDAQNLADHLERAAQKRTAEETT